MGSRNKFLGSDGISFLSILDPLVPIFLLFLTLKASHVSKNKWSFVETEQAVRLDILYRMVPQFSRLDFYFFEI
jgi:hypothetical protein